MTKKIFLLLITILFVSCGTQKQLSYNLMSSSNVGDPYSKYEIENGNFHIEYLVDTVFKDINADKEYRILIYNLPIYSSSNASFVQVSLYTYAAYAFENDKLLFFGFPEDYLKADDKKINKIGKKLAGLIRYTEEEL